MATKKDLVEAYSFSRRRLVTAFVSGAPGGREVEPARPGRTIVGGIALAVLLVAGAAVTGVFKSRADVDWDQAGLVIDEDNGALYAILDEVPGQEGVPRLRLVTNPTSGQLIFGSDTEPQGVKAEELATREKGPAIGIVDAPSTVPAASSLIQDGWTSCTAGGQGIRTTIAEDAVAEPAPTTGFLVQNKGDVFLLAEAPGEGTIPGRAYRYLVPDSALDSMFISLNVVRRPEAITVPRQWLELFPEGGSLDMAGLGLATGAPVGDIPGAPAGTKVGDYVTDGDNTLVLTGDGGAALADPFVLAVLQNMRGFRPQERPQIDPTTLTTSEEPWAESRWPDAAPAQAGDPALPVCAFLEVTAGGAPAVHLADTPDESASPTSGDDLVGAGASDTDVQTGHGAVVLSGDFDSTDAQTAILIDDNGIEYPLEGAEAITNLGYGDEDLPIVPNAWIDLFGTGVPLSRDAALCPPTAEGDSCT